MDIITVGMNMYMQGVDPELDFSDMPKLCHAFRILHRNERQPEKPVLRISCICSLLRFPSGCDRKRHALDRGESTDTWTVPYLPIDPTDIGRNYDADVIRINSQSGKGGVGYILGDENTA